jgi:hypothetical protein
VCGLVEIGGEDIKNGIFRQDGRINRSQEGNAEVRIVSAFGGLACLYKNYILFLWIWIGIF